MGEDPSTWEYPWEYHVDINMKYELMKNEFDHDELRL